MFQDGSRVNSKVFCHADEFCQQAVTAEGFGSLAALVPTKRRTPKKEKSSETGSGPLEFLLLRTRSTPNPQVLRSCFTFVRNQFEIDRLPLIETAEAGALLQSSIEPARNSTCRRKGRPKSPGILSMRRPKTPSGWAFGLRVGCASLKARATSPGAQSITHERISMENYFGKYPCLRIVASQASHLFSRQ